MAAPDRWTCPCCAAGSWNELPAPRASWSCFTSSARPARATAGVGRWLSQVASRNLRTAMIERLRRGRLLRRWGWIWRHHASASSVASLTALSPVAAARFRTFFWYLCCGCRLRRRRRGFDYRLPKLPLGVGFRFGRFDQSSSRSGSSFRISANLSNGLLGFRMRCLVRSRPHRFRPSLSTLPRRAARPTQRAMTALRSRSGA
mmetsp:Transcript_177421/g.568961  ORF Transcript_177421/g.568961 Transcript_177421/m.568961 type:complete len:203 (-) Transcript_177421:344-952(-)